MSVRRFLMPTILALIIAAIALVAVSLARLQPISVTGRAVGTNGVPAIVRATHPATISYAPGGRIDVGLMLRNDGPVPIRVTGLAAGGPTPSGYSADALRLMGTAENFGTEGTRPFQPFMLESGEERGVVVEFGATRDCDQLPTEAARGDGFTGAIYEAVELRYAVLGFLPRTQVVDIGEAFRVPQPVRRDCRAG